MSFKYPSDWQVASDEFIKSIFGFTEDSDEQDYFSNLIISIVGVIPESLNGGSFLLISQALPFPMSSEKLLKDYRQIFSEDHNGQVGSAYPILVDNQKGYKFDVRYDDLSFTQTYIVFAKGSKGYIIAYTLGELEKAKNMDAINTILNSFTVKETKPLQNPNQPESKLLRDIMGGIFD